jgi:excisionase family DNA binding protein
MSMGAASTAGVGAESMKLPRLLTVEEVRAELNIGRTLAYQLVESGVLPVVRIGHVLRIRRVDLDEYVEANLSTRASQGHGLSAPRPAHGR